MSNPSRQRLYTIFLAMVAATPPLATDMYLAAIPEIAKEYDVSLATANLSLVLWFVAYSVSLLIWGSLSDRYGRRPILLSGLAGFVIASLLCAHSTSAAFLIAARVLQGAASAGASSMVMAIARDRYEGKERQRILAWLGIILGLAPMAAPTIGSLILSRSCWQNIFHLQASLAFGTLVIASIVYKETALILDKEGLASIFKRYARLARNTNYALANGATGLMSAPFFGFIGFSSTAYTVHFGLSKAEFGAYFAANAACAMLGSATCAQCIKRFNEYSLLKTTYIGCLLGGVILFCVGSAGPLYFATGMGLASFFFGMSRPLVNHVILEQVNRDIGAASSGIVCYQFVIGAAGMAIVTSESQHPFLVFGIVATLCPTIILGIWPHLLRRLSHEEGPTAGDAAS